MKPDLIKLLAVLALVMFTVGTALADTVYLADGRSIDGKVTRSDGKVSVETSTGIKIFDKKQVLYIAKGKTKSRRIKTSPLPAELLLSPLVPQKPFAIERASRPEPIIFYLMRKIASAPSSQTSANLKSQLKRWRIAAHDKKRNVGRGRWTPPEQFLRRRHIFQQRVEEATELLKEAKKIKDKPKKGRSKSVTEYRKQLKLESQGWKNISEAAGSWHDLQGRMFLKAAASFNTGDFAKADSLVNQCVKLSPYVAVFSQLHGMALMELNRHSDALIPLNRAMQLNPSDTAYSLLTTAMKKTAGSRTESSAFLIAARTIRDYKAAGSRTRQVAFGAKGFQWLIPGKALKAETDSLPILPYDRLDFNQGIAVPVGPSTLLVDDNLIKDATEIYVRINGDTVVPATAVKGRTRNSKKTGPPPPLALLTVKGCVFTPLDVAATDSLQAKMPVNGYGLNYWFEMGVKARAFSANLTPGEQENTFKLTAGLAPGEASGPILNDDGQLVGFLAGKTDPTAEMGGTDRLILSDEMEGLIKRAQRTKGKSSKAPPRQVPGKFFVVHAISTETLP